MIVRRRIRPDYRAIITAFIRSMAELSGMTEAEYRRWMRTEDGEAGFEFCAAFYKVPLFHCAYKPRKDYRYGYRKEV